MKTVVHLIALIYSYIVLLCSASSWKVFEKLQKGNCDTLKAILTGAPSADCHLFWFPPLHRQDLFFHWSNYSLVKCVLISTRAGPEVMKMNKMYFSSFGELTVGV